jgi:hypothetical protein
VGTLFAAFLGYNPVQALLGPAVLGHLPAANAHTLTGRQFFPDLIAGPFHDGLVIVFWLAIAMALVGALASLATPRRTAPAALDAVTLADELDDEFARANPLAPVSGGAAALGE